MQYMMINKNDTLQSISKIIGTQNVDPHSMLVNTARGLGMYIGE